MTNNDTVQFVKSKLDLYDISKKNIDSLVLLMKHASNDDNEKLILIFFEVLGMISLKYTLNDIMHALYSRQVLWDDKAFIGNNEYLSELKDATTCPLDVDEGVLQCHKCNGFKIISYQKQVRSADEGLTTFAQCSTCGNKWRHNN